jgi:hypothetical protein
MQYVCVYSIMTEALNATLRNQTVFIPSKRLNELPAFDVPLKRIQQKIRSMRGRD